MHRIPIGVLGASGYAGRELCALVERHPRLSLAFATANEQRGKTAELPGGGKVTFIATDDAPVESAKLVFSAMPHGASKVWVERARAAGAKVVDLSADLRIGNDGSVVPYGLTEARREGRDDQRCCGERRHRRGIQRAHRFALWRGHGKFSRVRRGQHAPARR